LADGEVIIDTSLDPSGLEEGLGKLGTLAKTSLKATTVAISAVTTALSACAAYCVKVGSDFESAMSQVEAISGASSATVVTAAGEMVNGLDALSEKAKEMGATTKFSATEAAEALNYMAMAGWEPQQMYDGLAGIMNLAAASGENLATTSDIVTDALTAFGMAAGESGHFANILASTSASSNTNVALMGETFKYVAPLCGTLGYSAEDAAIAIGLMANSGIKGSQAGTALKTALANMAAPTDKIAGAMEDLGISMVDSAGNSKTLMEVMQGLRTSFADLSETEQAAAASTIFGKEAMSGMLAIINASDEEFAKLTESIYDCEGAAESMAATMQDNLQGQLTILMSGVEGLGIAVFEKLQEPLKELAIKGQEYISTLYNAFNENGFDGLVTSFGDVLVDIVEEVANAAPRLIDAAASLVHSFCIGIQEAEGVGTAGSTLIVSFISAIASCTGDMWSTAITLIGTLAEGIASGLPDMIAAAGGCVQAILDSIVAQLPVLLSAGLQIIETVASGIISSLPSLAEQGLTILSTLFDALMVGLPQITEIGISLIDTLTSSIATGLPQLIPMAMEAIVSFSGTLRENVGLLIDSGLAMIQAPASSLISNIPTFLATVPTIITNLCGCINDNAPKLLEAGISLIVELAAGLIYAIPDLIDAIPAIIEAIIAAFSAFNWVQFGSKIITMIGDGFRALATHLPDAIRKIGQSAKDCFANMDWNRLGSNVITWIANGINALLTTIPKLLVDIGKSAISGIKSMDWLGLGSSLIKGMASGVASAASSLVNAAVNAASNAIQRVKSWLGINSPSRRARDEIGKHILPGIGQGIDQTSPELNDTMQDAASEMINSFDTATEDIDVSGLVKKMRDGVTEQVGNINANVSVKTRTGTGQVDGTMDEYLDYEQLGDAVARGFVRADVKVECDDREFGRLISDIEPA